jgi:hypothetical protein
VWISFETQPAVVARGFKDRWHTVVDLPHQLVGGHSDNGDSKLRRPIAFIGFAPRIKQNVLAHALIVTAARNVNYTATRECWGLTKQPFAPDAALAKLGDEAARPLPNP